MPRELLLLRHGKSDWNTDADDFNRPLKDRGKRGAQRLGVWLAQQNLQPDSIITSPAERALVTAEKCCKAMGRPVSTIEQDKRIYDASTSMLFDVLASCPNEAQRVMLVGHNPELLQLLFELADSPPPTPENGKIMPTATLARLAMPDDWATLKPGDAKLLQLIRGSSLAEKFPFPSPNGEEQRDRPAYYYTQSSVIPYRFTDDGIEILIVGSGKNKHWVVPKGVAEPGMSLQDSACKEAWEEAGVDGKVSGLSVGSYNYTKWGATCTTVVYPMQVLRELPTEEWEESYRGRQWVSPAKAAKLLKQQELHPMVLTLNQQLTKA